VSINVALPGDLGRLAEISRAYLFSGPTPLQPMPNLTRACGSSGNLFVKRDDCTELAFGGNKVRQLEFYLGEAMAQDADTILITGAVQSNFVRLAAAAARKLGMDCHIQLEERVAKNDPLYRTSGNVLLDRLLGATMHSYPEGEDEAGADRQLGVIADGLRREGKSPYIIPLGPGHAPLGALGYVVAAAELLEQITEQKRHIDEIVLGSGSGATHAGMLFGLRALGSLIRVTGICVRRDAEQQFDRIQSRCQEIADLLDVEACVSNDDIVLIDDFLAPGYGKAGEDCLQAIVLAAQTESLMLDPTYTGKVMAGFIRGVKETADDDQRGMVFLHTGGTPAIFAYENDLDMALSPLP
jgi:D-cysteine desulfhydrase family pyridoxal phosphate-dependent enzyme